MRPLLFAFVLLCASAARAASVEHSQAPSPHPQSAAAAESSHAPKSCEEILSAPESEHEASDVSTVVFHHVTDNYVVKFESPFSNAALSIDFKRIECRLFHWNGVVPIGRGAIDLTPTKHAFWMWVAALLLIAIFWVNRPKKGQLVPRGIGALLEVVVLFVRDEIARKNIGGKEAERYTPFLLSCFFFIFMMNVLGLLPYVSTPTGNIGVTLGLSLLTFLLTQSAGIRAAGLGGYLKHLTGGVHPLLWPIMIPVEFLGLFTKPFALTMRLFANMAAGHIIIFFLLGLIFVMNSLALAPVSVAFAFGIYLLEILVALIQAYVFTMLSALFIGFGAAMGEHAEHGEVEAADPPGQLGGREAPIP